MLAVLFAFAFSTQPRRPAVVKKGDTIVCDVCKAVVNQIEELLKDQKTEEEIAEWVAQACVSFSEPLASICSSLAKNYIPIIMKLIEQGMEEADICTLVGFCSSKKLVVYPHGVVDNGVACDMCKKVITYVEELLKDQTVESEIAALVAQLCQTFPAPYSSLCDAVVKQYVPIIIQWIESGLESVDICTKLGLCSIQGQKKARLPPSSFSKVGDSCQTCTEIVNYVVKLLEDGTSEKVIATLVSVACSAIPFPFSTVCSTLVASFLPFIIHKIGEGVEALDICNMIGYCGVAAKVRVPKFSNVGDACSVCTDVVDFVVQLLEDGQTEEAVANLVAQFCTGLTEPISSLCTNMVKSYLPLIIKEIGKGVESLHICSKIGICGSAKTMARLPEGVTQGQICDMCIELTEYIEALLKDQKIEEEIKKLVAGICQMLPAQMSSVCSALINQYVPLIIEWIEQGIESIDICHKLGFCPQGVVKDVVKARAPIVPVNAESKCELCQSFFKWAASQLQTVTVDTVWELVSKTCASVPYLKEFCQTITEENIKQIVDLIHSEETPRKACEWLQVCN